MNRRPSLIISTADRRIGKPNPSTIPTDKRVIGPPDSPGERKPPRVLSSAERVCWWLDR